MNLPLAELSSGCASGFVWTENDPQSAPALSGSGSVGCRNPYREQGMPRLLIAILCWAPLALAADDLKVSQLEQDVRNLQRQLQAQAQLLEELRLRLGARPDTPSVL